MSVSIPKYDLNTARIDEKMVGEYFVFTSPDIPGMYAADKDRQRALDKLIPLAAKLNEMAERRKT